MNKLFFLDIDGVLNSGHFLEKKTLEWLKQKKLKSVAKTIREADRIRMEDDLDPNNIKHLQTILKAIPDLRIVLSTTWRVVFNYEDIKTTLKKFGIPKYKIIGKTPHKTSSERCHEILMWLHTKKFKGLWAAVDDNWIFYSTQYSKHEFHTNFYDGLTEEIADKIIKYFKKKVPI